MTEKIEDSQGWKVFMELRQQAQCGAAAGMSDAEVEAEIAAYRSRHEPNAK